MNLETKIGKDLDLALELIKSGNVIGVPTETVYGLAADHKNESAVQKIFQVKNRPSYDPLILHISNLEMLYNLVENIDPLSLKLANAFWPGPLTLVLKKSKNVSHQITSGLETVGIRMPKHPLLLGLIRKNEDALAAPSANPFGYISPTSSAHVYAQLQNKIPYILDGGNCKIGIESTIIKVENDTIRVLRLGGIKTEELEPFSKNIIVNKKSSSRPEAPGMLDSHYSPSKKLYFIDDFKKDDRSKIGIIRFNEYHPEWPIENQMVLSPESDLEIVASKLYSALREMDQSRFEIILVDKFPNIGLGRAINDRLSRAVKKN